MHVPGSGLALLLTIASTCKTPRVPQYSVLSTSPFAELFNMPDKVVVQILILTRHAPCKSSAHFSIVMPRRVISKYCGTRRLIVSPAAIHGNQIRDV